MVLWCRSISEGEKTLTSAPMSTRKWVPEAKSWMKKRRLEGRPGSLVIASDWPRCFPTWSRWLTLADTITKPKVIPAVVGRAAGAGGMGAVEGTG